ncbi:9555_t:CDS:2, partial [Acaulospora morrowiae]
FAGLGKFIAIVIEIIKQISLLVVTLAAIVMIFANSLFVLLRDTDPQDLVSQYSGSVTNSTNGEAIGSITLTETPSDSTNIWVRLDWSMLATYSFLGIGWDGVSAFEPTLPLSIMKIMFSFLAVILLLNVLIGLITYVFSDGLQVARQAFLRQRAELIAEIELFILTPAQRQEIDWFPHLIYYETHADYVNNWRQKLDQEERGTVDVDFVRKELQFVKEELQRDLKELKNLGS